MITEHRLSRWKSPIIIGRVLRTIGDRYCHFEGGYGMVTLYTPNLYSEEKWLYIYEWIKCTNTTQILTEQYTLNIF